MNNFDYEMENIKKITPSKIKKINNEFELEELKNRLQNNYNFAYENYIKYYRFVTSLKSRLETINNELKFYEKEEDKEEEEEEE